MMQQYHGLKSQHRDSILFFRLGDFYEMFYQDAKEASKILGLTLTQRNGVPMCGIPYHASQAYTSRLLGAGKKIAVCEQTKLPEGEKGIAQREVVEVLTPGTILEESMLDRGQNNFLLSLGRADRLDELALAALDVSTGELLVTVLKGNYILGQLRRELYRFNPREIIIQESLLADLPDLANQLKDTSSVTLNRYPDWFFDPKAGYRRLTEVLGVHSLTAFGLAQGALELYPIGALLDYVQETVRNPLAHLQGVKVYTESEGIGIDESSQKNLELVRNMQDGGRGFTLLEVIDHTQTPMGARLLRQWVLRPLVTIDPIRRRLTLVRVLYHNQRILGNLAEALSSLRDLERLNARVASDKAHGKELQAVGVSIEQSLRVITHLELPEYLELTAEVRKFDLAPVAQRILATLDDSPAVVLHEGGLIRAGVDPEIDRLRALRDRSQEVLDTLLIREKEASGITNLRLKFNKIIGYHFEVSKGQATKVPTHFIRRQSLVNGERYTTEELGVIEQELTSADELLIERERQVFIELRDFVKTAIPKIAQLSSLVAYIDCLQSLARTATQRGWTEPEVVEEPIFRVKRGRHPVVEAHLPTGSFVPNDMSLAETPKVALITGPNMAGKSTFLRQNALLAILAQMGSFVPADSATIGICDRVFCRVGASDNLARGESTFLVEMTETALILQTASPRSLIIMDEVGRGTSTQDGLSIAQGVLEYLLNTLGARTLFATHYHELTSLTHPLLENLSLAVAEEGRNIVFLKKVVPGASSSSYGIHVAQLAGIPRSVVERAFELLQGMETGDGLPSQSTESRAKTPAKSLSKPPSQPGLFDPAEQLLLEMKQLDPETLSPLQALVTLSRWKSEYF